MARPQKIDYSKIVADYKTGQYSVKDLCARYGVKRTTLLSHFERNNIKVCDNLRQAVSVLDRGMELFAQEKERAICDKISDTEKKEREEALQSGLEYLEQKHGLLARVAVNIVAKSFKKANSLLDGCEDAQTYRDIMSGFKTTADVINLFPKQPMNQINIQNNNANIQGDKKIDQIKNIKFEIVSPQKNGGEWEVIDGVIDNE